MEKLDDTFDLIISDFNMPEFNRMWLANQIKKKFNEKIPVIIMTSEKNDEQDFSVVSDLLLKPVNADELLLIVSQNLEPEKTCSVIEN